MPSLVSERRQDKYSQAKVRTWLVSRSNLCEVVSVNFELAIKLRGGDVK